jgi:hypothetical protein
MCQRANRFSDLGTCQQRISVVIRIIRHGPSESLQLHHQTRFGKLPSHSDNYSRDLHSHPNSRKLEVSNNLLTSATALLQHNSVLETRPDAAQRARYEVCLTVLFHLRTSRPGHAMSVKRDN